MRYSALIVASVLMASAAPAQTDTSTVDSLNAPTGRATPSDVQLPECVSVRPHARSAMYTVPRRPTTMRGRFVYWGLADLYRGVSDRTMNEAIATNARRAAAQYDRAAPSPNAYADLGIEPGDVVIVSLHAYGACTTRAR